MATRVNLAARNDSEVSSGQRHRPRIDARKTRPNLSSVKDKFVEWLATPESLRVPKTQRDFSREHGVNEVTLWRWKGDSAVLARVEKLVNQYMRNHYADVAYALVRAAIGRNAEAIRLYLQYVIGWVAP